MERAIFDRLAAFNKFELSREEQESINSGLDELLSAAEALAELDMEGVQPLVWALGVEPRYREDRAEQTVSREALLSGAPQVMEDCFAVPQLVD